MRVVPTLAAVVATSLLVCVTLSAQCSEPYARQQLAQNAPSQPAPQQLQAQPEAPQLIVPTDDVLLILIRAALIGLDQANVTGNYTVLRDMAAPGFKQANSPDRLAQIFAHLRQRKLDLLPILVIQPKLYRKAQITSEGMLTITGFFPIEPERINFDLLFQPVEGQWRLFGININTVPAQQTPALEVAPLAAPAQVPEAAAPAEPEASPAATPKLPKTTKANGEGESAKKQQPKTEDIRDRLDNPPSPPPEDEEPKEKSFWNPFAR